MTDEELSIEDEFSALDRLFAERSGSTITSSEIINITNTMEPETIDTIFDLDDPIVVLEKPKRKYTRKEVVKEVIEEPKLSPLEIRIAKIKELAEFTHPGNWFFDTLTNSDRSRLRNDSYCYQLTIYFDETLVTNSNKEKHTIKDLYVIIHFNSAGHFLGNLKGFRGKITIQELASNYLHSHNAGKPLENGTNPPNHAFCLGGGDSRISIVANELAYKWNDNTFQELLLILHSYVAWESIEGGPYRRICNITNNININTSISDISYNIGHINIIYDTVLDYIKDNRFPQEVFFNASKLGNIPFYKSSLTVFDIENNLELRPLEGLIPSEYFVLKNSRNEYFQKSQSNPIQIKRKFDSIRSSYFIKVDGKEVYCDIEDEIVDQGNLKEVIHPYISKKVLEILNMDFNNYIINK